MAIRQLFKTTIKLDNKSKFQIKLYKLDDFSLIERAAENTEVFSSLWKILSLSS